MSQYCCRVKQCSPLAAPGQGLSGVGMMLILSQLTYRTVLSKSNKTVNLVSKRHFISIQCKSNYGSPDYTATKYNLHFADYSQINLIVDMQHVRFMSVSL